HVIPADRSRCARNSLSPGSPTRVALRARTNLQDRNPAKTKTTLRHQNHPRRPLPRRVGGRAAVVISLELSCWNKTTLLSLDLGEDRHPYPTCCVRSLRLHIISTATQYPGSGSNMDGDPIRNGIGQYCDVQTGAGFFALAHYDHSRQ